MIAPLFDSKIEFKDFKTYPERLVIGERLVKVPRPDKSTLGQNILFMQAAEKAADIYEAIPELLAIFLQPEFDGDKFDRHKVPALRDKILQAPGVECLAVFGFFLSNVKNLNRIFRRVLAPGKSTRLRLLLQMKRKYSADLIGLTPL